MADQKPQGLHHYLDLLHNRDKKTLCLRKFSTSKDPFSRPALAFEDLRPRSHEAPQTELCRFRVGIWLQRPREVWECHATKDGGQRSREKEDAGPEHRIRPPPQSGSSVGSGQETLQIWNSADGPELHYGPQPNPDRCQQTHGSSERLAGSTVWRPTARDLFLLYAL